MNMLRPMSQEMNEVGTGKIANRFVRVQVTPF